MSTVLGTYQADILNALTTALTGYSWSPGQPPPAFSAPPSAALGYVWVAQTSRDDHDHLVGIFSAMVRVYPVQAEPVDEETPIDPAPLYQAVDDVNAALSPVQAPAGGSPWFYEITDAKLDHTNQYVDFAITAYGSNPFALT